MRQGESVTPAFNSLLCVRRYNTRAFPRALHRAENMRLSIVYHIIVMARNA
jgi:hypothetical protein